MKKEIKYTLHNGREKSKITETETFLTKTQDGWDMIGFVEIGKKRNTWIPLGANVVSIEVFEAETGRKLSKIF